MRRSQAERRTRGKARKQREQTGQLGQQPVSNKGGRKIMVKCILYLNEKKSRKASLLSHQMVM